MSSTCLLCYEESEHWVLPPCNHREICWKCCLKLVEGSIFRCPICKSQPDAKSLLLFVTTEEMKQGDYATIMKSNPFRSNRNTFYFYSSASVAEYIQAQTSFHCVCCGEVHESLNLLRKHLNAIHKLQFCQACLDNRRCIVAEQRLFSQGQLLSHLKQGDLSESGEVLLYHPNCDFCAKRFYDLEAFKMHLRNSAHLKCQVCDLNAPRLKYVYYRNYDELELHHKKTHFVCDVGECVGRKLQNVFASQGLLQEHKRRYHRKHRHPQEKVQNILLGFNQQPQDNPIDFDGIGKNLQREFTLHDRQEKVDKQQHCDELIDIREFYQELARTSSGLRPQEVADRLENLHQRMGNRVREVRFNDVPLFKPLEMSPLSRVECERLLRRCCGREAEGIIQIFFTKRHEYTNGKDYFTAIEKRLKSVSPFAFFLLFPQLVRFMKDQNRNKLPMDQHYALKLRGLAVSKELLCHAFDRYSQLLEFLRELVREEVGVRCSQGRLEMEKYCKYLKEMSNSFYVQNQDDLYFVPREKATNLYHMIERCRTKDFFKMNWLLKVGLPQQKYQQLVRSIHYKTRQQCDGLFQSFHLKELALLNLYFSICMEALLDQRAFQNNKRNPRPHYLTDFLSTIPRPSSISNKLYEEIRTLQGHSNVIQRKVKEKTGRPIVVDEGDCPSLLTLEVQHPPGKRKPPEEPQLGIGKARLPIWNEEEAIRRKNFVNLPHESHDEEFPVLTVMPTSKKKETGVIKKEKQDRPQEDFPVFNFKQKFVAPKVKQSECQVRMEDFLGFNSRTVTSKWDEGRKRQRFEQMNKQRQEEQLQKAERKKKKQRFTPVPTPIPKEKPKPTRVPSDDEEDEYLKMAIRESLRTAEQEESKRNRIDNEEEELIIMPKKEKINEQAPPKKGKKKAKQEKKEEIKPSPKKEEKKEQKNEEYLFDAIEREAQSQPQQKNQQPLKMRIDYSDDEEEVTPSKIEPKRESKPQPRRQPKKRDPIDTDEFMPIGGGNTNGESIITKLQKQAALADVENSNTVVKNGKKGKKIVIKTVNWF